MEKQSSTALQNTSKLPNRKIEDNNCTFLHRGEVALHIQKQNMTDNATGKTE